MNYKKELRPKKGQDCSQLLTFRYSKTYGLKLDQRNEYILD